jgi:plastocyanin
VVFRQNWTGEPHTVTGGTRYNAHLKEATAWFGLFDNYQELTQDNPSLVNPDDPGDATWAQFAEALKAARPAAKARAAVAAYRRLRRYHPDLVDIDKPPAEPAADNLGRIKDESDALLGGFDYSHDDEGHFIQSLALSCFMRTGAPPTDPQQPCSAADRRQPAFDGRQSIYNSGVLPYEGAHSNTFRVPIARTIKPGAYYFYCSIHGPGQLLELDVRKPSTPVPSASAVRRAAHAQAEEQVRPLESIFAKTAAKDRLAFQGHSYAGPFAGLPSPTEASVNEFLPRTIHAKVGEPITWKIMGAQHTITFNVPPYIPIYRFETNRLALNHTVRDAAGGAPPVPASYGDGVTKIDGGTFDGLHFWSSGLIGSDPYVEYTVRITKPGTYNYACLVHPPMIGKVIVR